jgi:hypothetical protein
MSDNCISNRDFLLEIKNTFQNLTPTPVTIPSKKL